MRFFLRTGFGELKTFYGGSHEERLAGYGQGNAAAGPGFTAIRYRSVRWSNHQGRNANELSWSLRLS